MNFVFSTGSGSPQTVDINGIKNTTFFEISANKDGSKHLVNIVPTAIHELNADDSKMADIYSIDGRLLRKGTTNANKQEMLQGLPQGIYVIGGKKVLVR